MKKKLPLPFFSRKLYALLFLLAPALLQAQTSVITTETGTNYSGSSVLRGHSAFTFLIENTNAYPINISQIDAAWHILNYESVPTLWYSATSLSGPAFIASPAWYVVATGSPMLINSNGYYPTFTGINFTVPANTQYRFAIEGTEGLSLSGFPAPSPTLFTAAGVNLKLHNQQIAGSNIGYRGAFPDINQTPVAFTGRIHFEPANSCSGVPVAGNAAASGASFCIDQLFTLSLSGYSTGTGISYQWQSSASGAPGSFNNIAGATSPLYTLGQPAARFYRALVSCSGGGTAASNVVQVSSPAPFASGSYTINSGLPTGGGNFQTFTDAVNAISCGISGPVTFEVAPGTSYNEQIEIPQIGGTGPNSRVTFNGNGATIGHAPVVDTMRHVIRLNRADYISINNLNIDISNGIIAGGWGIHLMNRADHNHITNSTITGSLTLPFLSSNRIAGIVGLNTKNFGINYGNPCNYTLIEGNQILFTETGIEIRGENYPNYSNGNQVLNNQITDFNTHGILFEYQKDLLVSGNDLSRPTRTNISSGWGINIARPSHSIIEKNKIHNPFGGDTLHANFAGQPFIGIMIGGNSLIPGSNTTSYFHVLNNEVRNNLIYNVKTNNNFQAIIAGPNNTKIYHNTIDIDNPFAQSGNAEGIRLSPSSLAGPEFKNNIIRINKGGNGAKYGIYLTTAPGSNPTGIIHSNYNVLNVNGPNSHVAYRGTAYTTLADWQTQGQDLQSVPQNPQFTNPALADFTPTNALVDDIGAPLGLTEDITGAARSLATPDPGAFETYIPVPCPAPTQVIAFNIDSTQATITWNPATTTGEFTIFYGQSGFNMPGNIIPAITGPPYTLTGLTPNTQYQVFVQNDCGTAGMSTMSVPGTFTTISCPAPMVSGPAAFCFSGVPDLQLQGFASGAALQWETGASVIGPFSTIPGATGAAYTAPLPITETTWYRAYSDCGNGPVYSNVFEVEVLKPEVTATNTPVILCAPGTAMLTASATQGNINWYSTATGGAALYSGSTYSPTITAPVTYYVEASIQVNGTHCALPRVPVQVILSTIDSPIISTSASEVCPGEPVTLSVTNQQAGIQYLWSTGVSDTFIIESPAATSSYSVTASNAVCSSTSNVTVTVHPQAQAVISPSSPQSICSGQNINLSAGQSTGNSYSWQQNGQLILGANGPVFAATSPGSYAVIVSQNGFCADTSLPVAVAVLQSPTAAVSPAGPVAFCDGDSVTLTAAPTSGGTYQWLKNNEQILGATGTEFTAHSPGNYQLVLTENTCTDTSLSTLVQINLLPTVTITQIPGPNCPDPVTLLASGADSYVWSTGATTPQITAQAATGNFYSVTGQSQQGCAGSDSVMVAFPACEPNGISVPNIITPNNDGVNDVFLLNIPGQEYDLQLFNRWGKVVFSRQNYNLQQDWRADGLADGLYYYFIKTSAGDDYKGWLEVVR